MATRTFSEKEKSALLLQSAAFDASATGLVITDVAGIIQSVNPAFCQMTGYSRDDLIGHNPRILKSGEHPPSFYRDLWKTILSGQVWYGTLINRRKDGALYHERQTITPIRDNDGRICHFIACKEDISKQLRLEEAMRHTYQLYRDTIDNVDDGILVYDRDLRYMVWNHSMEKMTGVPASAVVGKPAPEAKVMLKTFGVYDHVLRALEGETVTSPDLCHPRPSGGGELWTSAVFTPRRNKDGKVIGVVGVVREITARKHSEVALRDSEERFREMTANIQEVFWLGSADLSEIFYVSPAYERIWGRPGAELLKNPRQWFEAIHPEDRDRMRAVLDTRVATEHTEDEFRILRPDGALRWVRGRTFPIRDGEGKTRRIAGITEDVTAKKHLESRMLRAQRLESIGSLAGGIAHDLNNILGPILMGLQLLKSHLTTPASLTHVAMMEKAAQRGGEMVRQITSFARGTEGKLMEVQVRHVIAEVEKIIRASFPKNIEVVRDLPNDLHPISADPTQIHQMLMNLCVNARDAMTDGGQLTLRASNVLVEPRPDLPAGAHPGPHVAITVSDTGTGMSPEVREKLFQPFFTTKAAGRGTGLGLCTVAGIVESHGGFLEVSSEPGKGSQFRICIPASASPVPESAPETNTDGMVGRGELVLVVDDEVAICEVSREVLESHGYRVLTANDGAQAVSIIAHNHRSIQMLVTDLMMPYMDGVATIETVRKMDANIKILVFTGASSQAVLDQKGGAAIRESCPFLRKPFSCGELLEAVQRTLHTPRAS